MKIRENKLNLKIGWVNYGKKSACFASPISRSPPLNRHVSSQRSLIFKRAHNTNQLSLCLDAGRLCHSRPVQRVIAICKLQTPAEVRFWDKKLSYCHTSGLLLHNFPSVLCESVLFNEGFSTEIHFQAICRTLNRVIFLAFVPFSQFYEKLPSTYKKCWSGVDIAKKFIYSS